LFLFCVITYFIVLAVSALITSFVTVAIYNMSTVRKTFNAVGEEKLILS
jgi:uncharacterized membrane protein (DUF485 family)